MYISTLGGDREGEKNSVKALLFYYRKKEKREKLNNNKTVVDVLYTVSSNKATREREREFTSLLREFRRDKERLLAIWPRVMYHTHTHAYFFIFKNIHIIFFF